MTMEGSCIYLGGSCEVVEGWDIDEISSIEVGKLVKSLGYLSFKCLWYKDPHVEGVYGIKPLNCDADILQFLKDVKQQGQVDVYVEHHVEEPISLTREHDSDVEIIEIAETGKDKVDFVVGNTESFGVGNEYRGDVGTGQVDLDSESGDEAYDPDCESDSGSDDDISLDDSDYEEAYDWMSVLPPESLVDLTPEPGFAPSILEGSEYVSNPSRVHDFDDENGELEDHDSPPNSDGEESTKHGFPMFRQPHEGDLVHFEKGQIFRSRSEFKAAVKDYALEQRKNLKLKKNDRSMVLVICDSGCPFYMNVTRTKSRPYFQMVGMQPEHSCTRSAKNRQASTSWLG
jgi:hypothetical protein